MYYETDAFKFGFKRLSRWFVSCFGKGAAASDGGVVANTLQPYAVHHCHHTRLDATDKSKSGKRGYS